MKLTELIKKDESFFENNKYIYGIEVDEFVTEVAWKLKEIGFLIQFNEDGTYLSDDLIDVMLDYKHSDVNVVLEVKFRPDLDIKILNYCANTIQVDISLLPPESDNSEDFLIYSDQLVELTSEWLKNVSSGFMLMPSSGYFNYMVREYFKGIPDYISNDEYFIKNYVDKISLDRMDAIKLRLREVFINHFGGQDELEKFLNTIAYSISEKTKEMVDDYVEQINKAN